MRSLRFARVDSELLGPLWVAETAAGLAAVSSAQSIEAFFGPLLRRFVGADATPATLDGGWIDATFHGTAPPALDLTGISAFDMRVYGVTREIPCGQTLTYGDVAALAGSPGAARAVGGAMSRCPFFPAVPCHRVVRASDGWSGWGGQDRLKRRLLDVERTTS